MPYVVPSGRILTSGDFLERPVRELMSPGVIAISAGASLEHVHVAMTVHRVHALLVVEKGTGAPQGWITARSLLEWIDKDIDLASAADAVIEQPRSINSGATTREAIEELTQIDTTHLLVIDEEGGFPVGTVSDLDLASFVANR